MRRGEYSDRNMSRVVTPRLHIPILRTRISCIFLSRYYILWLTTLFGQRQQRLKSLAAEQKSRREDEF